jgi:predicted RNase H-like HicB family nuclease
MTEKYLVVIEQSEKNYSAYSPDVLGCVATGDTIDETVSEMRSALEAHIGFMIEEGDDAPKPKGVQAYLDAMEMSESSTYFITHLSVSVPSAVLSR